MKKVLMGNHSVSYGVMLSRVKVIAAYPITPQTQIVEELSELCASKKLDATFIKVESEHSALACVLGASLAGSRAFTATSSQGLALMHELIHWAGLGRYPIVLANVNRAMAPGWNIWSDQNDSLSQRDCGWIQLYCENNQEVLDNVIIGYRIAEKVLLPVMLVYDAFILSHTYEIVDVPDQTDVDRFLPPFNPEYKLDIEKPASFGGLTSPDHYYELRYNMQQAMEQAVEVYKEAQRDFNKIFGRDYPMIEEYRADDAQYLYITSGSLTSTARIVVDELREKGYRVGLLKIKVFRPMDKAELIRLLKGREKVFILDRNISVGVGGIFAQEIKAYLYGQKYMPEIYPFIIGLGGRDIPPSSIMEAFNYAVVENKKPEDILYIGLKK
jgi:pyruvate/2-oxoacid:ferredoxin oxidoreductase alpha subunit